MNNKIFFSALLLFLILGSALASLGLQETIAAPWVNEKTLVLYDAASGAIPEAPLMGFTDFPPGVALPTFVEGVSVIDTTIAGSDTYAGWVSSGSATPGFPTLDRSTGFQVNFNLQLESESHSSNHRAGFSVIILANDAKGVELGFWQNEIWAQSDDLTGGLFRHAEGAVFATNAGLTDYQVTMIGDTYTLAANGLPILTGPLRDYSAFDGFPDPYETPSFLFIGDDTTSAQARVRLSFVSVTGTEQSTPTAAATITSISSPLPTVTDTPPPSATPIPSPTPVEKVVGLCPSGWMVFVVTISTAMLAKIFRADR